MSFFLRTSLFVFLFSAFGFKYASSQSNAQVFWIQFKDKGEAYSIQQPQFYLSDKAVTRRYRQKILIDSSDFPVSAAYCNELTSRGFKILCKSKWLNAVAAQSDSKTASDRLISLPFIKAISYLGKSSNTNKLVEKDISKVNSAISILESKFNQSEWKDTSYYGKAFAQLDILNIPQLHKRGLTGKQVSIAVLDAGFNQADRNPYFKRNFDELRIESEYDFVDRNADVYDDDDHGVAVWSCMAANTPNKLVGASPDASYLLLRSEDANSESLVEECYWVAAAEYADSAGADIINSSLGYNTFDDPFFNHTPKDLCGNKTIVSKGASAAAAKGILVVNSAGNEGNNEWRLIGVPADAFNILTIGAVDDRLNWSSFSSIGNTADKRIKPDVSAQGEGVNVLSSEATIYKGDGTSYSCPIMAGALACIFQAVRPSSIPDLINCVRLCASRYYTPDKYLGYGIPDMILLLKMLGGDSDYSISKDVLLDARILDDKKLHVSILSNSKQKVKVNIADMRGNTLYAETISNIVKGANRIPLALKLKKLKPGMYSVYLTAKDGVSSEVFLIK